MTTEMDNLYKRVLATKDEYDLRRAMYLKAEGERAFSLAVKDYREAEEVYHNMCVRFFEEYVDSLNES